MVVDSADSFYSAFNVSGRKTDLIATLSNYIGEDAKHIFKKWGKVTFHMDKGSFKWTDAETLPLFASFFPIPVKGAVEFVGWYKDSDYKKLFVPRTDAITEISDLYARWADTVVPDSSSSSSTGTTAKASFAVVLVAVVSALHI